jgi:hypothetical protein
VVTLSKEEAQALLTVALYVLDDNDALGAASSHSAYVSGMKKLGQAVTTPTSAPPTAGPLRRLTSP